MKKIAIVTLLGSSNYGNKLQNYATQEVLRYLGFEVETLLVYNKCETNEPNMISFMDRVVNLRKRSFKEIFSRIEIKIWNRLYKNEIATSKLMRKKVFEEFTKKYIVETDFCFDDDAPKDIADQYHYFVAGSDQVWNPEYTSGSSIYFLTFAPEEKRIAFSPSFGVTEIKSKYISDYKKWILGMNKLSVREEAGAKIIKDLTGRDAQVLVDPTLLISKEKWLSIAKEANNKVSGNYLLTYFLGGIPDNFRIHIKNICKGKKLEVINLGEIKEKETYRTGPSEFVDYINSCSLFCTDSFHGAVFSILMEKPFIIYKRKGDSFSMYSRIDTLLNKFNLNSRKAENILTIEQAFNIDFSYIAPILGAERSKVLEYLKNAFGVKEPN